METLDSTPGKKTGEGLVDPRAVLNQDMDVYAQDGEVGKLDSFITDPEQDEQITHIVVRQGFLLPTYIPVPISLVQGVDENGVHLATTKDGAKDIANYAWPDDVNHVQFQDDERVYGGFDRSKILSHDLALRAVVADAISEDPVTENAVLEVVNEQGIVTLIGTVENANVRQAAEKIALQQPGVISVINSLKVQMTA